LETLSAATTSSIGIIVTTRWWHLLIETFRRRSTLLAAGQITGTEGYAAAVAGGWLAGTNAARLAR
jgi:tRNA U34 5-carboxymethylaminomethyl modifying enzyme MnmG/GidA